MTRRHDIEPHILQIFGTTFRPIWCSGCIKAMIMKKWQQYPERFAFSHVKIFIKKCINQLQCKGKTIERTELSAPKPEAVSDCRCVPRLMADFLAGTLARQAAQWNFGDIDSQNNPQAVASRCFGAFKFRQSIILHSIHVQEWKQNSFALPTALEFSRRRSQKSHWLNLQEFEKRRLEEKDSKYSTHEKNRSK